MSHATSGTTTTATYSYPASGSAHPHAVWKSVGNVAQDVGAAVVGVAVAAVAVTAIIGAVGCTAITFGLCGVVILGAFAVGGALAAGVTYALSSQPNKSASGELQAMGTGAVSGVVGGAAGEAAAPIVSKAVSAIASKLGGDPASGVASSLASRADTIHSALDQIAQNMRTTAVVATKEGTNFIGGGVRDLNPAQAAMVNDNEQIARLAGAHAEVTAVNGALNGLFVVRGVGASVRG